MMPKRTWTVVVVILVVSASAATVVGVSRLIEGPSVTVVGGAVLSRSGSDLVVRCLSPKVELSAKGFSGTVTFTNCFANSTVAGFSGDVRRSGTTLSFAATGGPGNYTLQAPEKRFFSFAVTGDSEGRNNILRVALNDSRGCDFVVHCGDLTPSGTDAQYAAVEATLNGSSVPVMTTRGNHDIRGAGAQEYASRFGPSDCFFDYSGVRFAIVDSSNESITPAEISWLGSVLAGATRTVIVTHVPTFDPFGDNPTLDSASCARLQNFATEHNVTAVFAGHIHAFYMTNIQNTKFVITGGAGGPLVAGGYSIARVTVTPTSFSCKEVDLGVNVTTPQMVTIVGRNGTRNLTIADLVSMPQLKGHSSFQNLYGNIKDAGTYKGVAIGTLVGLVGGMSPGDVLNITAADGYSQTFGYLNVYPNATWLELQGPMVLALEFNGSFPPVWQVGPRIAMLPSDGYYSNSDCQQTSYPGQGYSVYPSAGARWVSNVMNIVVEGP